MTSVGQFMSVVGFGALFYWGFQLIRFFSKMWHESLWSKTVDFKKYGSWAVVTGSSDGIGKAIARELAQCGLNVVLLSRTESKLEKLADDMRVTYGVKVKTIAVDFTSDDAIYDVIKEEIANLDIAVLVNNVGMAWIDPADFLTVPNHEKYSSDVIRVNVNAMVKMTEMVLPGMVQNKGGIVVNVSSIIGSKESPYFAMYGASKSSIITFTTSMAEEYKSKGVIFQCIAPAMTATPLTSKRTKSGFIIPTADLFGSYAVKAIGKSTYTNTSYLWHNVFQQILHVIPDVLYAKLLQIGADRMLWEKRSGETLR